MRNYEYVNGVRVKPHKGFFTRLFHGATAICAIVGVIAIVVMVTGWKPLGSSKIKNAGSREAIIEEEEKFHGIILTTDNVVTELREISELMTYSEKYA